MALSSIQEIIEDMRQGRPVILMDDEDRENEGDIIIAAEAITPEHITFFASEACGLICLTLTQARARQLQLSLQVQNNQSQYETNFTASIDAAGLDVPAISSEGRARTVKAAIARDAKPSDISQPGHIFPIVARPGGVLTRSGHTEAGCDLARLAGFEPASVIVEIVNEDGSLARRPELEVFGQKHQLKLGTIADLIAYRALYDQTLERIDEKFIETEFGQFKLITYRDLIEEQLHFALVRGDVSSDDPVMVRVHVNNTLRDQFHTIRPNGHRSWSLHAAMEKIAAEGRGVIVLISKTESVDSVRQQIQMFPDIPSPSAPAGEQGQSFWRVNGTGSQILRDLKVSRMRLLSSPVRFSAISGFNLEVTEFIERS